MASDLSIVRALFPVFLVILTGYLFRRLHFPDDAFWNYVERFVYFILFPALLLQKTATAPLLFRDLVPMAAAILAAILVMAGLLFLIRPWVFPGGGAFTSFFQGGIRFNTYVGLSAAFALFADEGLTLAAVAIAILIPLVNILSIVVLVVTSDTGRGKWFSVLFGIIRNPLILACAAGMTLNAAGIVLHTIVNDTLVIFGRASLPLGLLAVGAGLNVSAARAAGTVVLLNCSLKLLVLPLFMWAAASVFQVGPTASAVAVLFAALPCSASSYILARQLGGDSLLMANLITIQAVLSMVTIPVIMIIFTG